MVAFEHIFITHRALHPSDSQQLQICAVTLTSFCCPLLCDLLVLLANRLRRWAVDETISTHIEQDLVRVAGRKAVADSIAESHMFCFQGIAIAVSGACNSPCTVPIRQPSAWSFILYRQTRSRPQSTMSMVSRPSLAL